MKKIAKYIGFVISCNPLGFFTSCLLFVLNLLFAAGLYGMASFLISLAALHPTYDAMMIPVVSVRLFGVGRAVLSYSERYISHDNTFRILQKLRLKLYDKMLPDLPDYRTRRGDNLNRLIADIELLQEGILRLIYPLASSLLLMILGGFIAYWIHPIMMIVFVVLFIINYLIFPSVMFYLNSYKSQEIDYNKQNLYKELLELKEGIHEISSDNREALWIEKIQYQLRNLNGNLRKHQTMVALCEGLISFLQGCSLFLLLFTAVYLAYKDQLPGVLVAAGTLGLFTIVTEAMLPSHTYFKFRGMKRAIATVLEPSELQKKTEKQCETEEMDERSTPLVKSLEMESSTLKVQSLTWSYDESRTIIENFSMELKVGEVVALVGESGCGKSTLVNLILGFIKPQTGMITYGDKDLSKLTEEHRLKIFSVVDQKPFFFHQSILENLQLGNPEATKEDIMYVLKKVGLEPYIISLEKSLDTPLFEWGSNLSTGELQRMAIARALLKKAQIYIFDEPTAGLDSFHEKVILNLIFELKKEHGVLLITHGHNMLDQADSIIRLNNT